MAAVTHLLIRTLHMLGMALLLGGVTVAWLVIREGAADSLAVAVRYEWLFWLTLGVVVLTGVGNLGAVGAPGPATDWGQAFLVKLLLVVGFVVGSLLRTLVVVRMDRAGVAGGSAGDTPAIRTWTRRAYAATGWVLLAIVVLGEVLAHG